MEEWKVLDTTNGGVVDPIVKNSSVDKGG